jgi:hypothetical protein
VQRQAERAQARDQARSAAARHVAQDAEEDARFGDRMGDEMAEALSANRDGAGESRTGRGRRGRVGSRRALAELEAEREQADAAGMERAARRQARVDAKGGRPVDGRPPAGSQIGWPSRRWLGFAPRWRSGISGGSSPGRVNPCPGGVEASYRVRHALARVERAHQVVRRREARQDTTKPGRAPLRNINDFTVTAAAATRWRLGAGLQRACCRHLRWDRARDLG